MKIGQVHTFSTPYKILQPSTPLCSFLMVIEYFAPSSIIEDYVKTSIEKVRLLQPFFEGGIPCRISSLSMNDRYQTYPQKSWVILDYILFNKSSQRNKTKMAAMSYRSHAMQFEISYVNLYFRPCQFNNLQIWTDCSWRFRRKYQYLECESETIKKYPHRLWT